MSFKCNIDAKGKVVRLIYGVALAVIGIVLAIFWAWPNGSGIGWIVSSISFVSGAFAIFESRSGWCVIRAMGFKTPI